MGMGNSTTAGTASAKRATRRGRQFSHDTRGSFTTWLAAGFVPIALVVGVSIDAQTARGERANLADAADAAALAAIINSSLSVSERESFARDQFFANYSGDASRVEAVDVEATSATVEINVRAKLPASVSPIGAAMPHRLEVRARAEVTEEDTICVLALNPDAKGAVRFKDSVGFRSPNCSVHSNSTHREAILSTSDARPQSRGFCAVGSGKGAFSPALKNDCRAVQDPYAGITAPRPGLCVDDGFTPVALPVPFNPLPTNILGRGDDDDIEYCERDDGVWEIEDGCVPPDFGAGEPALPPLETGSGTLELDANDSGNIVENRTVLRPGTYCGGLTIAGDNVLMLPGVYIMKDGPFVVKDAASVRGDNVLVSLSGKKSALKVETGGRLTLKAADMGFADPTSGAKWAWPGLAVIEDTTTSAPGKEDGKKGNKKGKGKKSPKSKISDGALSVTGTVYLPNHKLEFKGDRNSRLGVSAPATSFIVDRVEFKGSGTVRIDVDHDAAGIPAILPRTDEGARLVR